MQTTHTSRRTAIGLAVCAGLLAGGCSTLESTQPGPTTAGLTTSASAGPSPSAAPMSASPTATPSAQCPAEAPATLKVSKGTLPSGKSFGFVRFFDGTALYVDPAEFLGGNAAVKAAREDGEIGPHEDLPNPFYIRNQSTAIVRIPVSAKLRVTVLASRGGSPMPEKRTAGELAALYCGGPLPEWAYGAGPEMPANLTIANGEVVRIDEQYVP